jgi:hypothetical protein
LLAIAGLEAQDVHDETGTGQSERILEDRAPPRDKLRLYYPKRRNPFAAAGALQALGLLDSIAAAVNTQRQPSASSAIPNLPL